MYVSNLSIYLYYYYILYIYCTLSREKQNVYIVSNKAKGRISKRWSQKNKKFPKTNVSLP